MCKAKILVSRLILSRRIKQWIMVFMLDIEYNQLCISAHHHLLMKKYCEPPRGPGSFLICEITSVNRADKDLCFHRAHILVGAAISKRHSMSQMLELVMCLREKIN